MIYILLMRWIDLTNDSDGGDERLRVKLNMY